MKYLTERENMSEAKETGKVVERLVKEYRAIISGNESAIRAFIKSAHKTPARDLEATLKEASKSGAISAIRPAYANYFDLANTCLAIPGADKVAVYDFMKEVACCQRTLRKEGALELVARISNWDDFVVKTREAEKKKKDANNRGGKGKGKGKKSNAKTAKELVTADAVIAFALGSLRELEGDNALITNFDQLEALEKVIKSMKANSLAVARSHPVKVNA